jgi:hypothetical protein
MKTVHFDEITAAYIDDLGKAMREAQIRAAEPFALQMNTAVQLFIRQNKLDGSWKLSPDGKSITSEDQPNIAQRQNRKKK